MKLSTRSRYALEGMLYLAVYGQGKPLPVKEIADGTEISVAYLEQIFFLLKNAGITSTVRGSHGGCIPAKSLTDITAGMIVRAIDGAISPVDCVENPDKCATNRIDTCITRPVWVQVTKAIAGTLDNITLEELRTGFLGEKETQKSK